MRSRAAGTDHELEVMDLNSYELIDKKEALMTAERTLIKELGFEMWSLE
jgi:hypothetical protein